MCPSSWPLSTSGLRADFLFGGDAVLQALQGKPKGHSLSPRVWSGDSWLMWNVMWISGVHVHKTIYKNQILPLAPSRQLLSWSDKLTLFLLEKMSTKFPRLNNHSLSVLSSKKRRVTRTERVVGSAAAQPHRRCSLRRPPHPWVPPDSSGLDGGPQDSQFLLAACDAEAGALGTTFGNHCVRETVVCQVGLGSLGPEQWAVIYLNGTTDQLTSWDWTYYERSRGWVICVWPILMCVLCLMLN